MKKDPKDPKREEMIGTFDGFYADIHEAETFHGIRVLMKKHFPVLEETRSSLVVQCREVRISFVETEHYENGRRDKGERTLRWQCHLEQDGEKSLLWYQEKKGIEFASSPVVIDITM